MLLSRLTNQASGDPRDSSGGAAHEAPFLADSYAEDWERLERFATRRRFVAGEDVVRQGDVDRSLIIVLSGALSFVVATEGGAERVLSVIDAPSVVGEVGFFDPGPRSGTLRARADGELLQLGYEQFEALAASSPSLARTILLDAGRIVAMRLRRATAAASTVAP
jgi:CRP/FNR family transcriptional regulator, cyclic AMP receptor protein